MSFQRVHLNIAIMTCIWGTHTACFRFTSPCRLSFKDVVRIKCSIVICLAVNISFQLLNFPLRLYYCMFASPLYHSDPTNRQQTLRACSVANVSHSMLRLPADVLSLALSLNQNSAHGLILPRKYKTFPLLTYSSWYSVWWTHTFLWISYFYMLYNCYSTTFRFPVCFLFIYYHIHFC